MNKSIQETLLVEAIRTAVERLRASGERGLIDPEFSKHGIANPRYQEICLTFAVAVKKRVGLPEELMDVDLEAAAASALDGWLTLLHRSGAVRMHSSRKPEPQATAYGAFAVAATLGLLGDLVPVLIRKKAANILKKTARFLVRSSIPPGLDARPLRFAALKSIAEWTGSVHLMETAEKIHQEALSEIESALDDRENNLVDSGALSLALAYLAISVSAPSASELETWRKISARCLIATAANGITGGGAESSVASIPLPTGFELAAELIPEACETAERLYLGWEKGFYSSMLDTDVPWLTPITYLIGYGLEARKKRENECRRTKAAFGTNNDGSGLLRAGDWVLRLGRGATIGWMYHRPTGSTRVFGSPAGLSLREGPWIIKGNNVYHSSFSLLSARTGDNPWSIEGSIAPIPIPGMSRPPRHVGFPGLRGKGRRQATRLVHPPKPHPTLRAQAVQYLREIEIKDGALTIETHISGRIIHRLPVIWTGGKFGKLTVGKKPVNPDESVRMRKVREIVLAGGDQPPWTVRFDRPVDLLYEPIHGPVVTHPMRFLTAAAGTFDFIAEDRFHAAWRVG